MQQMIVIKRYISHRYCLLMTTRTKIKKYQRNKSIEQLFIPRCFLSSQNSKSMTILDSYAPSFNLFSWNRRERRIHTLEVSPRERIYATSIDLQRPGSISWISARVRVEQPRVHFDDHPRQSEMVRKAAIQGKARVGIALDETKEEGWKERKSTKGKPEFLVLLTADYQSDLHRETKINFRNGKS